MVKHHSQSRPPASPATKKPAPAAAAATAAAGKQVASSATTATGKQPKFAVDKKNYRLLAIGLGVMAVGFILMLGGGSDDPDVFDGDRLFSFTRITLSVLFVIAGLVVEIYAIMKRPNEKIE
jgi:hypothetical protein